MKANIITKQGKSGSVEVPEFFSINIRGDVAQKFFESQKELQPYAPNLEAGKHHSASGNLSHSRRLWKTAYGKGISRVPRKIMWRRGDHFYWVGAETSGTRGGRQAHPPRVEHFQKQLKVNKKEAVLAIQSALASTVNIKYVRGRYESLRDVKIELPIVVKIDNMDKIKTSDLFEFLEKTLGDAWKVSLQVKTERAGKGKIRNRRYKKNAGLLMVIGNKENLKVSGIEVRKLEDLEISDLYPLGRLTVYTEEAMKELKNVGEKK